MDSLRENLYIILEAADDCLKMLNQSSSTQPLDFLAVRKKLAEAQKALNVLI